VQKLWFRRPQGRRMPQCGGEGGEKDGGESLDLCSKHACNLNRYDDAAIVILVL